jgi:hypothetical protein
VLETMTGEELTKLEYESPKRGSGSVLMEYLF